ncbi:MAG TPA: thioredoxin domain-containing protein [Sporolactobacillaceae bacterium]|nr:thioredoxin domain-containing protein [Sporolactobacillaceae bacterium]
MPNKNSKNETSSKQKRKQTMVVMISTVVVLLLIAGIVAIVLQNKDKAPGEQAKTNATSDTGTQHSLVEKDSQISYANEPRMGQADAPVRIAEFGDYKCMFCHQFEMEVFPKLKKDFIDTGKVQFYFMNYTIIAQDSVNAANAGEAVYAMYPDHFWDFHQLLYENQGPETEAWVTNDLLINLAKKAVPNLDVNKFTAALDQMSYIDQIRTDVNMGKAAGVTGTPTVFINGTMVPGQDTLDYDSLKAYIQKAIDGEK